MAAPDPQIVAIMRGLTDVSAGAVRRITLRITDRLIRTTPVDTGWARANWVPSIGLPVTYPEGSKAGVTRASQQQGLARVVGYRIDQGAVYISNNVPYIQRLNEGSSRQAPAMFVEAAIEQGVNAAIMGP